METQNWKERVIVGLICFGVGIQLATGYKFFQEKIPSGQNVPHPCRLGEIWKGVGHERPAGAGVRNPFGRDFHANGKKWDRTICMMDSDMDGKTNGEELGDTNCEWIPGQEPASTSGISHPGICDPWNSEKCKDRTRWVSCDDSSFKCPAVGGKDIMNTTIRFPPTSVPAKETIYMCMYFDFPSDKDYHLIGNQPFIDNENVMHHILMYGCDETKIPAGRDVNKPWECEMVDEACRQVIGIWSFGMAGECAHEKIGFRIGTNGFKKGIFQTHWNNPEQRGDYVDSSGLVLHLTTQLREHDAGILTVGQEYLAIPPGQESVTYTANCPQDCTNNMIKNPVQITVGWNHMHYLGKSQKVELMRNGKKIQDITNDPVYDYETPYLHIYKNPITLQPGDELKTTCEFTSVGRNKTTFFGDGTYDEMCYSFLTYYPKQNIPLAYCGSWQSVTDCAFDVPDVVGGCEYRQMYNISNPETRKVYDKVMDHCSPFTGCRTECIDVVREVKKGKCLQGEVNQWARISIEKYAAEPRKMMKFYAALDSCDVELAKEKGEKKDNGANGFAAMTSLVFLCVSFVTAKRLE